jgi:gluconolactonase
MKFFFNSLFFAFIFMSLSSLIAQDIPNAKYPYDPARDPVQENQKGEVMTCEFISSVFYPQTKRTYWIYVPKTYTPEQPACLYVGMDGISFDAPTVFDNLIATGEMPVTIGVFVAPGIVYDKDGEPIRFNRSNEFDRMDDTFVRFLLEELLLDVESQKTPDGRTILLSKRSEDRAIGGSSSGAICAFTAAWNRPDAFSRVFSAIGTYVSMRGGNEYPALIRKTEPKQIRIFLEDGNKDAWNLLFGSWFDANLDMQSALSFAGYEVAHSWGTGGHDGEHANAIFPDVLRWLWKGWPNSVGCNMSKNDMLEHILDPNFKWKVLKLPFVPSGRICSNKYGEVFITDNQRNLYRIKTDFNVEKRATLQFGENLYGCNADIFYTMDGKSIIEYGLENRKIILRNMRGIENILVVSDNCMYVAEMDSLNKKRNIWLIDNKGTRKLIDSRFYGGSELIISPDHKMIITSEESSNWLLNYVVDADRTISLGQQWYWLHDSKNYNWQKKGNMTFDTEGNLYVATSMGIQVCDHNGRVRAILSLPSGDVSSICFAGENRDKLFIVSGDKIYYRKLKIKGATMDIGPIQVQSQGIG